MKKIIYVFAILITVSALAGASSGSELDCDSCCKQSTNCCK